jgi:hypothetical protein
MHVCMYVYGMRSEFEFLEHSLPCMHQRPSILPQFQPGLSSKEKELNPDS